MVTLKQRTFGFNIYFSLIKMLTKLFVFGVTFALINTVTETSAQYNTYEIYEVYPQPNRPYYQPQNTQQYYPPQKTYPSYNRNPYQYYPNTQNTYQQQQNAQVTVTEAEWVCRNPKTNDMMIIATDDLGSRNNGPVQWHQVNPPNNQPNYVQPQPTFGNPTIPQVNPTYTTTEKAPVWPSGNTYQPNQAQVNPTTETYTTTEREQGPVWPSANGVTTKKPVYTTTPRPLGPIWPSGGDNKNVNNGNKGFTVDDKPTTKRPFFNNPFFDPTTQKPKPTTTATNSDGDDEGIEIIMGK